MNGTQRALAAVHFEPVDRAAVMPQVFGHAALLADVPLGDYVRSGELLARCQLRALEQYGYDAVFAVMDVQVETEALGSELVYRPDLYPVVGRYVLQDGFDPQTLRLPDPVRDGRMPELLKALRLLRAELGDETLVVGCVAGPMTLVTQLLGIETALYLAIDETERFVQLLDFAARVAVEFGLAQIEAGAHLPLVFDPSSSPDVIPPQFYREFVLPHLERVFLAFKTAGAVLNWLHTAGPVKPILPYYAQAGVDLANIDFCVDLSEAAGLLPHMALNGNIRPLAFVQGDPRQIESESRRALEQFAQRGGFVLSSGCEIPLEARPENVRAMVQAVHRE